MIVDGCQRTISWWRHQIETMSALLALCEVIPLTKAGDAKRWCFLWFTLVQTLEQTIETPVVWDAIYFIMTPLWCAVAQTIVYLQNRIYQILVFLFHYGTHFIPKYSTVEKKTLAIVRHELAVITHVYSCTPSRLAGMQWLLLQNITKCLSIFVGNIFSSPYYTQNEAVFLDKRWQKCWCYMTKM